MKFYIEYEMDGYESEPEMEEACKEYMYEQLNFTASSYELISSDIDYIHLLTKAVELLQADNKDLASWHIAKDELIKEIEG